ncbi:MULTISPECIES: DUF2164 domain-containing protein [Bacillus]|uniref:DUF2164 domain-containing protein n=1 Tax=Bacillus TaxID=1386 RepID=UPI0003027DEB|nr:MULTISPECIES: DUF2164 domain-containing protein [Bacillus]
MIVIKIPREQKLDIVRNIQHHFYAERDEEIGELAAENLLDFMLKQISPHIYNQAIHDAQKTIEQKVTALEEDLYALVQPIPYRD